MPKKSKLKVVHNDEPDERIAGRIPEKPEPRLVVEDQGSAVEFSVDFGEPEPLKVRWPKNGVGCLWWGQLWPSFRHGAGRQVGWFTSASVRPTRETLSRLEWN